MKKNISLTLIGVLFSFIVVAADLVISGVSHPVIYLNGKWNINITPGEEPFSGITTWQPIQVPGECCMQGFKIKHDQPFVYKKEFRIPSDYKNNKIILHFEGVYSFARLWVNGKYIREHSGGFTAWEADITPVVVPGSSAVIILEVTDKADEISYASGYAHHPIGGILRNVSLRAIPFCFPADVSVITDFDQGYQDAKLTVQGIIKNTVNSKNVSIELFDNTNNKISLSNYFINTKDTTFKITNDINHPVKWDAEHPNLYRLKISLIQNGQVSCSKNYLFGFRKIEVKGNKFLINGQQVKLRGACRHDVHPLLGRVATPEYDLKDVLLAKEANINFIRTSHYPPSDYFLTLCDKYGIYVEDETAVCFVNTYRSPDYAPGATENSPQFTDRYLSQLKEMVQDHRNHPSVILWSIGNENKFGLNFQKSFDWIKANDATRSVIFSFPGTVREINKPYDLLSMHYPNINGGLEQYGLHLKTFGNADIPVLFDEWAHVPCYNKSTVREDPNVRNFWGMSLDSMWQKTFDADGGLGGAIWGLIDETFMLPDTTVGYGEWGIIDTWRRKKPEFWNVKKAYSPVRILHSFSNELKSNKSIRIPVYNRYDFTNLSELSIRYKSNGALKTIKAPSIPPHTKGNIQLDLDNWLPNAALEMEFIDAHNKIVDQYSFKMNHEDTQIKNQNILGKISLQEDEDQYFIHCENNLVYIISKETGLFTSYQASGKIKTFSGPWLNFRTKSKGSQTTSTQYMEYGKGWKLNNLVVNKKENTIEVNLTGQYKTFLLVDFVIRILPEGSMITKYNIKDLPKEYIRELGLKYVLDDHFEALSWMRNGYWSKYPTDHISSTQGKTLLYNKKTNGYRKKPLKAWQSDSKSFYYDGIADEHPDQLTFSSKATKENIFEYTLLNKDQESISIKGTGNEGCRLNKTKENLELFINNLWDYPDLAWGNFQKNILPEKEFSGQIHLSIHRK